MHLNKDRQVVCSVQDKWFRLLYVRRSESKKVYISNKKSAEFKVDIFLNLT